MLTLSPQILEIPAPDTQTIAHLHSDPVQNGYPPIPIEESFPECTRLRTEIIALLVRELPPQLYYHNSKHTVDVCKSVERLAFYEGLDMSDLKVTWTAALLHDTGFLFTYNSNELLACRFAQEILPGFGYKEVEINQVSSLIMATTMPQKPGCLLEKIICDADLDYLGRNDFFITALRLHREWSENSGKKIPFKNWYEKQRDFMVNHRYFTESAQNLRNNRKAKNLEMVHELIEMIDTTVSLIFRKNY